MPAMLFGVGLVCDVTQELNDRRLVSRLVFNLFFFISRFFPSNPGISHASFDMLGNPGTCETSLLSAIVPLEDKDLRALVSHPRTPIVW